MVHTVFCESCTMPMEQPDDHGTEKDGTKSQLYCKYCYENGKFVNPSMTLDQMGKLITTKMNHLGLPENVIHLSLKSLPHLKRWKNETNDREQKKLNKV